MGIIINDLTTLDAQEVQAAEELLSTTLQELTPGINAKQGVLRDYLGYHGAVLGVKNQTEARRLRLSQSLLAVQQDPSLADADTVDNIAANFRVTRKLGLAATGVVTMVVSVSAPMTVAAGTTFTARGQQFRASQAFTARTSAADVVSDTDRVLTATGDGNYSFQLSVESVTAGGDGNVLKDTLFATTPAPVNYVKAFAAADFTDGTDTESNQDLLSRFVYGTATKAFSGRDNMAAALRNVDEFAGVVADSIVGMGDQEMLRDKHSIFPGATGGRVDWYVRTTPLYRQYGETRQAGLVEKTADGLGIWQLSFTRDEYPGLYDVQVRPVGADDYLGFFETTEDIRSYDDYPLAGGDGFLPDIVSGLEAAFSRFQTVIIRFKDSLTETGSLSVGQSTKAYAVTVRAMPYIADMQDYALQRRVRNTMGDALIKAPVPCFLTLTFSIFLTPGQTAPDTTRIADSLASLVNYYGFSGRLPASALTDVIHNHLLPGTGLSAIDMFGRIQKPSGGVRYIRSSETLVIPDEAAEMSTRRTVVFFLDPADIAISVLTADTLPV